MKCSSQEPKSFHLGTADEHGVKFYRASPDLARSRTGKRGQCT